jgi:hypothetical protein
MCNVRSLLIVCVLVAGTHTTHASSAGAQLPAANELRFNTGAPTRALMPSYFSTLMKKASKVTSTFTAGQSLTAQSGLARAIPLPPPINPKFEGVNKESNEIVQGLVQAFFHKLSLKNGEAACLSTGAGKLAGDVASTSSSLFMKLETAMGRKPRETKQNADSSGDPFRDEAGDISAKVDGMLAGSDSKGGNSMPPQQDDETPLDPEEQKMAQKDLDFFYSGRRLTQISGALMRVAPSIVLELGGSIQRMLGVTQKVAHECLHQDALQALDLASQHMQSVSYVSGHLASNGQDIVSELADAVTSYKAHNFKKFGFDLGTALRKVFLSKATGGRGSLPEGMPDEEVVANVTRGLIQGFFGRGSELDVKLPASTTGPSIVIPIDMHKCISKNLVVFQSIWAELMFIFARKSVGVKTKDEMQWSTAVAFTMMQIPKAMERCSLGSEEQQMLEDAIKGLASGDGSFGWNFKMPDESRVSNNRLEKHLAITAKDWAKQRWETFGQDLGKVLQEMALTVFSQKYTLDSTGLLRSIVPSESAPAVSWLSHLTLALSAAVGVAGLGLAVIRRNGSLAPSDDGFDTCELYTDEEAVE